MKTLFRLAMVAVVHAAFFICYPDTGPAGRIFLWVSPVVWAGFILFLSTNASVLRLFSGLLGGLVNLAAFALMALAVAATLPQEDRVTALEKIRSGRFPSGRDINRGLARLGLKKLEAEIPGVVRELDEQAAGAVKKLQKELPK